MVTGLRERNRLAAIAHARRTAFELMAERGFDSVTVEEIASATNVSPSTLYRYFGTKEALVLSSSRPAQLSRGSTQTPAIEPGSKRSNAPR